MTTISQANNHNNWPTATESHDADNEKEHTEEDTFDWEIVPEMPPLDLVRKPKMKHVMSTPNLSHLETSEDDSYTFCSDEVLSESSCEQQQKQTVQSTTMRRVPSFKDAILLNAEEQRNEGQLKKEQQEKARTEAYKNRPRPKNIKFVVTPIKRCSKSTGDLRRLVKVEDDDDYYGGGGGGNGATNDLVLGDSDAAEFYASKGHARVSRRNGQKLRPDEAKRKEMIIFKKNAQRQQQQQPKEKK